MLHTQLRSFNAVAVEGSFTGAAKALNVSQSTITHQVKQLEDRYGVELFHRHGRGVKLTDTGHGLYELTRRLFATQQQAAEYLAAVKGLRTGRLKIGAVAPSHVTEITSVFNARYPGIEVSISFGNSRQVQDEVLHYQTDVGVLGHVEDHPEFHTIVYSHPDVAVVVNNDHPWSQRRSIRIEELEGQKFIMRESGSETRRTFEKAMRQAGVSFNTVMEVGSRDGLLIAVARGVGMGIMADEEVLPVDSLHKLAVSNAAMHMHVHVVCLRERKDRPLLRAFLDVVEELVRQNRRKKKLKRSA